MRLAILLTFAALTTVVRSVPVPPDPKTVAILYNKAVPESAALATWYAAKRSIPADNLIGLDLPTAPEISRKLFNETLLSPLRHEFDTRGWWRRDTDKNGIRLPVDNRIRVLTIVRGVPLKIQRTPQPAPPAAKPGDPPKPAPTPQNMMDAIDEASVDSELFLFGVEGVPIKGAIPNQYYNSLQSFANAKLPFQVLVGRLDGPDDATCRRMVEDALATEQTGLWGRAYVDIANKIPEGDNWLEAVAKACSDTGIPTIVDRFNDTFPTNYPMTEAALYFGWYAGHVDGPFLNPAFHFRRGAIAVHLHSFSASQLTNPAQNWSAPLLARGAAATVGNVYEPFLHLTHDLAVLNQRLLDGYTLVEAAAMATPAVSWQSTVLGDPLYQPFCHRDASGIKAESDRDFRALRLAMMEWGSNPAELDHKLALAATNLSSGTIQEARGLRALAAKDNAAATQRFQEAKTAYATPADRIRMDLHLVAMARAAGDKATAIQTLRSLRDTHSGVPEAAAATAWLNILDPPPPPPANPNQPPKNPPK